MAKFVLFFPGIVLPKEIIEALIAAYKYGNEEAICQCGLDGGYDVDFTQEEEAFDELQGCVKKLAVYLKGKTND